MDEKVHYVCSLCGLDVVVLADVNPADTKLIKACGCDAPVNAFAEATMTGQGGM